LINASTTSSKIVIDRPPATVFAFVTTPANWVGTHPVTEAVRGQVDGSAEVGTRWTEVIKDDPPFEVDWLATLWVPAHTWVIETDALRDKGTRCQIGYTFVEVDGATLFRRDMSVFTDEPTGGDLLAMAAQPEAHDAYLAAVKATLERA
jgi:polyketide cyclase/dehydrase/lipid transport protein